ncbi:MAG: RagB/SusD family nutrient uptake outer membrane protein [Bacteroidales bacterium]|nr:RagB/SusD family nutrient uptake outer membrane protein [Bacteroidales bacterium]
MKNIYIILIVVFIALIIHACEGFLDAEPMTVKTEINYYSTPEEASVALVGCYDGLQQMWREGVALPIAADVMSDLCFGGTGYPDGDSYPMMDEFDKNVEPGELNLFVKTWEGYYKGINRCNTLIKNFDNIKWGNQTELQKSVWGEVHFLRAYFYFDMVRLFEKVPLLAEPTDKNVPQAKPEDTYKLITEDLLIAIANCSNKKYTAMDLTKFGHATKWAAEALLARVYLFYTGYYGQSDLLGLVTSADALAGLEDIIANSDHALLDSFPDLWPAAATYTAVKQGKSLDANTYAGEVNKEVVFSIKYTYTSDYNGNADGNHWLVMNGIRKMYVPKYGYGYGWGGCTVIPEVYEEWNNRDKRKEASIMAVDEEGIIYDQIGDMKEYTGYFTKKYIPTCNAAGESIAENYGGVNFMIGQYQDYFVIRYADVLLMAAELGSPNALQYVNDVHTRAGLDPLSAVDKDVIFEERRLEFAFEGIRYWDLLRYDHTLAYAAEKVTYKGKILTGGIEEDKEIDGANLVLTRGLCQIPNNQITLSNGVLKQNPGWD